jgi:Fic family protein
MVWIWQSNFWPDFKWDPKLERINNDVSLKCNTLCSLEKSLGDSRRELPAIRAEAMEREIVYSSLIEGVRLATKKVRLSIAKNLMSGVTTKHDIDRNVDAVVETTISAMRESSAVLTKQHILSWHDNMFPDGLSEGRIIRTGEWREFPVVVVSRDRLGNSIIHYEGPHALNVNYEISHFVDWWNQTPPSPLKAGLAHLYFVAIHPFEDGNGRMSRLLSEMCLAAFVDTPFKSFSLSDFFYSTIDEYYSSLCQVTKIETINSPCDCTSWLAYHLNGLDTVVSRAINTVRHSLEKAIFWDTHQEHGLSQASIDIINHLLDSRQTNFTRETLDDIGKNITENLLSHLLSTKMVIEKDGFFKINGTFTTEHEPATLIHEIPAIRADSEEERFSPSL